MRIAVIADIHGNILALEAVLADLEKRGADRIVNLGDSISGPLWPRETAERLATLPAINIRGNHDREVAETPADQMAPSDSFAFRETTLEQRAYFGALPFTAFAAPSIFACHGTPDDDLHYLLDEAIAGKLVRANREQIARRVAGVDTAIVLCGHSHRADAVQLPNGQLILNPGSVGAPGYRAAEKPAHVSEAGGPQARYAILEMASGGAPAFEFRALPYAHEEAALRAERNGRPEWAHALRTGFMPPLE